MLSVTNPLIPRGSDAQAIGIFVLEIKPISPQKYCSPEARLQHLLLTLLERQPLHFISIHPSDTTSTSPSQAHICFVREQRATWGLKGKEAQNWSRVRCDGKTENLLGFPGPQVSKYLLSFCFVHILVGVTGWCFSNYKMNTNTLGNWFYLFFILGGICFKLKFLSI